MLPNQLTDEASHMRREAVSLPPEVGVYWLSPNTYIVVDEGAAWDGLWVEVRRGSEEEVAKWLRQHSYVGVWALAGYDGPIGRHVRKERVTA